MLVLFQEQLDENLCTRGAYVLVRGVQQPAQCIIQYVNFHQMLAKQGEMISQREHVEVFSAVKKGPIAGHAEANLKKVRESQQVAESWHFLCQNVILASHLGVIRRLFRTFSQNENDTLIFTYKIWLYIKCWCTKSSQIGLKEESYRTLYTEVGVSLWR